MEEYFRFSRWIPEDMLYVPRLLDEQTLRAYLHNLFFTERGNLLLQISKSWFLGLCGVDTKNSFFLFLGLCVHLLLLNESHSL